MAAWALSSAGDPAERRDAARLGGGGLHEPVRRLRALQRGDDERIAEDDGAADGLEPSGAVRLAAERVVDLGDHARRAERVLGQLSRQRVAVVALGERHDEVGLLGAGRAHDVLVGPVAAHASRP